MKVQTENYSAVSGGTCSGGLICGKRCRRHGGVGAARWLAPLRLHCLKLLLTSLLRFTFTEGTRSTKPRELILPQSRPALGINVSCLVGRVRGTLSDAASAIWSKTYLQQRVYALTRGVLIWSIWPDIAFKGCKHHLDLEQFQAKREPPDAKRPLT